jgi:hypothetical protein
MKRTLSFMIVTTVFLFALSSVAADKVVVIPIISKSTTGSPEKLWGQGRPGTTTLLHSNGTFQGGSCTASSGVKFSLSKSLISWDGAAAVCPKDTWVCSREEILDTPCPISILDSLNFSECDGHNYTPETITNPYGWVSDMRDEINGFLRSSQPVHYLWFQVCHAMRAWCCHN